MRAPCVQHTCNLRATCNIRATWIHHFACLKFACLENFACLEFACLQHVCNMQHACNMDATLCLLEILLAWKISLFLEFLLACKILPACNFACLQHVCNMQHECNMSATFNMRATFIIIVLA